MYNNKFKTGDRVIAEKAGYNCVKNAEGVVAGRISTGQYLVEFENEVRGYDGNAYSGDFKAKNGWYLLESELKLVEEEAKDFLTKMHEHGLKWGSGDKYTNFNLTSFQYYGDQTTYSNTGGYENIRFSQSKNRKILEWSDYMKKEFTLDDLRPGVHVVKLRKNRLGTGLVLADTILFAKSIALLEFFNKDMTSKCVHLNDIVEIFEIKDGDNGPAELSEILDEQYLTSIWKRTEKSPAQIRLEELEEKQRKLADEIAEVRKGL